MLTLVYSSGLRVSEIVNLTPQDIIRDKMLIRIRQGKGAKDRYSILSITALHLLEKYWKAYRPASYLFPGKNKISPLSIRACQHAFEIAKKNAGINKTGGIHTLRHSFATNRMLEVSILSRMTKNRPTHFLEVGGGLFQLQKFLGHVQLRTTLKYVHLSEEKYYCPKSS